MKDQYLLPTVKVPEVQTERVQFHQLIVLLQEVLTERVQRPLVRGQGALTEKDLPHQLIVQGHILRTKVGQPRLGVSTVVGMAVLHTVEKDQQVLQEVIGLEDLLVVDLVALLTVINLHVVDQEVLHIVKGLLVVDLEALHIVKGLPVVDLEALHIVKGLLVVDLVALYIVKGLLAADQGVLHTVKGLLVVDLVALHTVNGLVVLHIVIGLLAADLVAQHKAEKVQLAQLVVVDQEAIQVALLVVDQEVLHPKGQGQVRGVQQEATGAGTFLLDPILAQNIVYKSIRLFI
jgi:hypothetical protein